MLRKLMWRTKVRITIPIFGGPWDGSEILMNDLEPGKGVRLYGSLYVTRWVNGKPRMEYTDSAQAEKQKG